MPRVLLLLLLAGALAAPDPAPSRDPSPGRDPTPGPPAAPASVFVIADTTNDTITIADNVAHTVLADGNLTVSDLLDANGTLVDPEGDHDPVVRKKRTFGDIVFRGLADVLGYQVQRRPPQQAFPPPLAPVPGIDTPLQAAPAPAPAPAAAPPPCGAPRAAGPPPCRAQLPPPPPPPKPAPPPCAKPRAAPKPKPRPTPPPPPPPPCGRANPATPAPCAPPPPKVQADSNLETVSSNFQLAFNFNRAPATPATQAADEAQAQAEEQDSQLEQFAPIAIKPQAAKLPLAEPRKPRVYVDAFVVRNGVARRVDTVDAQHLNGNGQQAALDNDYLAYDDNEEVQDQDVRVQSQDAQDQDYTSEEDLQEYRQNDRSKAVKDFGAAVDRFWEQKQKKSRTKKKKKAPARTSTDYRDVHFGDRDLAEQIRRGGGDEERHQSLQRERPRPNRIPLPIPEEEDAELTTTTQDPRRRLKPRVLPPTEQNPGQIDTVTVRVPPIYKERHPKKLHRDDEHEIHSGEVRYEETEPAYAESSREEVGSAYEPRPQRRRKPSRRARAAPDQDPFSAGDFDYYGKRLPVSEEEKLYRSLTIPPPTVDADLARLERRPGSNGHFLDESEKLQDDRESPAEGADDDESGDEGAGERGEEKRLSDELGPNAKVQQTGYKKNYRRASNVKVDDGQVQPSAAPLIRKRIRKVIKT